MVDKMEKGIEIAEKGLELIIKLGSLVVAVVKVIGEFGDCFKDAE